MKKTTHMCCVLILLLGLFYNTAQADTPNPPALISESAVLIDADTGQVLYEKEMHKRQYPASITKIITCLLGIENAGLGDVITMSDTAVFSVGRDTSHISLTPGEQITVEQALYAAMLMSANDACNGIAEHISGSITGFAGLMTERARELGALDTNFNNANGLKDELHYTTAYDMAMITKGAIQNEAFRTIFGAYTYRMPSNNKQSEERPLANQHSMIANTKYRYDGIIGGKAGYTTVAQYTLVTAAERNGRRLIAVVMKSPRVNDKYEDTTALLDYGFKEFDKVKLTVSDIESIIGQSDLVLEGGEISLSLLKGLGKKDLRLEIISPEGGETPEDGDLKVILSSPVDGMYGELGVYPIGGAVAAASSVSIDVTEEELPEQKERSLFWSIVRVILSILGILLALLALLVLGIYIRKQIYYAKRRRRRR